MTELIEAAPARSTGDTPAVEEERLRRKRELALAFRLFGRFGFSEGVAGHITVRDPGDPECFWVNPYGMAFSDISVSDLLLVNSDGDVVVGERPVNRAAFCIHSQVHRARPDVVAAAHAHSIYGKSFATLGLLLDPITQDACVFYEDHSLYTEYGGVVNDVEEGRRIGVALGANKAVILQNHGLLTVGGTVAEAAWWFVTMERSCQAQLLAMAAGRPTHIDEAVARDVHDQIGGARSAKASFESLLHSVRHDEAAIFS
ncbi:ribulose-5-phosphate 4-epimerase/fuculose-1-phosphate aldolase [Nocardioides zeae]|uniref:Ribulose-5-phosphate 4-epimerase/fuculose-1-phosphate aldolase n=1 Tax=Nocardioides zeae TaxID=1457234 RepID=A0ACC6IE17_9ACTN|nr:class II aldolase/adducin family protein [Nocardioides zeae]MDR6174206.1 ribulose-5-phosphate 4-epimerase/fuculose-1-phosphate aldolase [Nocardioides zeae]MDR6209013.1 ribulose-5-phosphate 4-epimerase/fuculose-1-phosphate aldolase [Nocardioides zeae]